MFNRLLKADAKVNAVRSNNSTPLYAACCNGFVEIVELLLKHGADVHVRCSDKTTAFSVACQHGYADIVQLLLEHAKQLAQAINNTNINNEDVEELDHVEVAIPKSPAASPRANRNNKLNASIESPASIKITQLHTEKIKGKFKRLMSRIHSTDKIVSNNNVPSPVDSPKQIDTEMRTSDGLTPLLQACHEGHVEVVKCLIDHGCNLQATCRYGYTALHIASMNNHRDIVELLLSMLVINIDQKGDEGMTALHLACRKGNLEVVLLLLDYNANLEACTRHGMTALHLASKRGYATIAEMLLKQGARVNAMCKENNTPLHYACKYSHVDTAAVLIKYEADFDIESKERLTPRRIAAEKGPEELLQLIESAVDNNKSGNIIDKLKRWTTKKILSKK
jgi:ankyrin